MFLARSIRKVHFEFSEEACNGIPGSIHCGIDASAENTLNYCCWFIAWNRACRSLGGKCKAIFEQSELNFLTDQFSFCSFVFVKHVGYKAIELFHCNHARVNAKYRPLSINHMVIQFLWHFHELLHHKMLLKFHEKIGFLFPLKFVMLEYAG